MNSDIKISVIIPTFNRARSGLIKAITSALYQTYKPFEILVCDDGSSDNTYEEVKKLNNPLVKYIDCGRNHRPSIPRNIGILQSKGNWLAFLDSDDYWFKNKLQKQVNIIKKHNTNFICSNAYLNKSKLFYFNSTFLEVTTEDLVNTNYIINSSVLIRKDIVLKAGLFPRSKLYKAIEDYLLWYKVSFQTPCYFINESLLSYKTINKSSISAKSLKLQTFRSIIIFFYLTVYSLKLLKINLLKKIIKNYLFKLFNKIKYYLSFFQLRSSIEFLKKNKISIIMPVHNAESFLKESIESILNQSYSNFELLICDDCSSDRSREIINFYDKKSKKIKTYSNSRKMGVSKTLNFLLSKTKGKYIARMDGDDICYSNRFLYQVEKLKNNKIDVISNGVEYFGNVKSIIKFNRPNLSNTKLLTRLLFYNPINHPTIMFTKKVLNEMKYNSINDGFEDWKLWLELISKGFKIQCDRRIVLKYRLHDNNSGSNANIQLAKFTKSLNEYLMVNIKNKNEYSSKLNNKLNLNINKMIDDVEINTMITYKKLVKGKWNFIFSLKGFKSILIIINILINRYVKKEPYYS